MRYQYKQLKKRVRRLARTHRRLIAKAAFATKNWLIVLMAAAAAAVILLGMQSTKTIYTAELLETIAKVESNGNYNAYYGNTGNTEVQFTTMSVGEVMAWQKEFVERRSPSSAVGRYQFLLPTLQGLVNQLQIDHGTTFDQNLQDRLAVALLERRGLHDYMHNKISRDQFAHNLSKEWAALPRVVGENPRQSYYANDGRNKALLSIDELYRGISTLREI